MKKKKFREKQRAKKRAQQSLPFAATESSKRNRKRHKKKKEQGSLQTVPQDQVAQAPEVPASAEEQASQFLTLPDRVAEPALSVIPTSGNEAALEEANQIEDRWRCKICLLNKIEYTFLYCGHLAACEDCAKTAVLFRASCPVCRQDVERTLRIYIP